LRGLEVQKRLEAKALSPQMGKKDFWVAKSNVPWVGVKIEQTWVVTEK